MVPVATYLAFWNLRRRTKTFGSSNQDISDWPPIWAAIPAGFATWSLLFEVPSWTLSWTDSVWLVNNASAFWAALGYGVSAYAGIRLAQRKK